MRYIFYTFVLSLSCIFLINCKRERPKVCFASKDQALNLIQEQEYNEFPLNDLESICVTAATIQNQPNKKKVVEFHFPSIEGVFYRNPMDESVLFIPQDKARSWLGRGHHKKVYKGLWFSRASVEVVAVCIGDKSTVHEADIFKLVALGNSCFPFRAFFPLSEGKFVLVLRRYNLGGLDKLHGSGFVFTHDQKLSIAHDLASALVIMHAKAIAHRDLHEGNMLIHRTRQGVLHAGLIDFGRANGVYAKVKNRPQGASRRNPPEILYKPALDIKKIPADIYALGCVLYRLLYEKEYAAVGIYDFHQFHRCTVQDKKEMFVKVQETYARAVSEYEAEVVKNGGKTAELALKGRILEMLHPDPEYRIDCAEIVKALENVRNKDLCKETPGVGFEPTTN